MLSSDSDDAVQEITAPDPPEPGAAPQPRNKSKEAPPQGVVQPPLSQTVGEAAGGPLPGTKFASSSTVQPPNPAARVTGARKGNQNPPPRETATAVSPEIPPSVPDSVGAATPALPDPTGGVQVPLAVIQSLFMAGIAELAAALRGSAGPPLTAAPPVPAAPPPPDETRPCQPPPKPSGGHKNRPSKKQRDSRRIAREEGARYGKV